jgi:hypothetical protein
MDNCGKHCFPRIEPLKEKKLMEKNNGPELKAIASLRRRDDVRRPNCSGAKQTAELW